MKKSTHITKTEIKPNIFKLVPDKGWVLLHVPTQRYYSEAITATPDAFVAAKAQ